MHTAARGGLGGHDAARGRGGGLEQGLDRNPLPASCSTFFLVWLDTVHECRHHAGRLPLAWPAQRCLGLPLKGPRPRLGTPPTMSPRRRWSLPPGVDRQVIALARSTLALV